ncbi:MAG: hypothetical protein FJY92_04700 [Candidatus Hydrogenedentes bacterium]|nr:hypothetical protein [Candidatus Hydrogenedentota bacterium]
MNRQVTLEIQPQPDETTCGPTCLHAVYGYYDDPIALPKLIGETIMLEEGGTLAAYLAKHALERGYAATIYTYNLRVFDPTWFGGTREELIAKLEARLEYKRSARKLQRAIQAYLDILERGGEVRFADLTVELIESFLLRAVPIVTGLSSTFLYRCAREMPDGDYDDVRGHSQGHFVVLCGYDRKKSEVLVADPLEPNPMGTKRIYSIDADRVINSILLGVLTYDANLLIIEPKKKRER